jgi:tetratricopeptide (TPR) repeat protein
MSIIDIEATNGEASKLFEGGRMEEAHGLSDRVLEVEPSNYPALVRAGRCCLDLGRYEKAIEYLDSAIAINPGDILLKHLENQAFASLGKR